MEMKCGFIRLPGWGRRQCGPRFYRVRCSKCDYAENIELCSPEELRGEGQDEPGDECRKVAELPSLCPACGAKLKAQRIPVSLHY